MFGSLLILLILPITDLSKIRGNEFIPISKFIFWAFVINFFILMWIGSQHPESPYVEIGQISTTFYFAWFLIFVPLISYLENNIVQYNLDKNSKKGSYLNEKPITKKNKKSRNNSFNF